MTDSRGQGLKYDAGKIRPRLIPAEAIERICEVLEFGALKYEEDSWKDIPGAEQRYFDALQRHILAYQKGEIADPESGLHHLAHAGCNLAFLLWFVSEKEQVDKSIVYE
jgi:hypothetical protein